MFITGFKRMIKYYSQSLDLISYYAFYWVYINFTSDNTKIQNDSHNNDIQFLFKDPHFTKVKVQNFLVWYM